MRNPNHNFPLFFYSLSLWYTSLISFPSLKHTCQNGFLPRASSAMASLPPPFVWGLSKSSISKLSGNGLFKEMGKHHFFHCFSRLFHSHHLSNSSFQVNACLLSYLSLSSIMLMIHRFDLAFTRRNTQEQTTKITKTESILSVSLLGFLVLGIE